MDVQKPRSSPMSRLGSEDEVFVDVELTSHSEGEAHGSVKDEENDTSETVPAEENISPDLASDRRLSSSSTQQSDLAVGVSAGIPPSIDSHSTAANIAPAIIEDSQPANSSDEILLSQLASVIANEPDETTVEKPQLGAPDTAPQISNSQVLHHTAGAHLGSANIVNSAAPAYQNSPTSAPDSLAADPSTTASNPTPDANTSDEKPPALPSDPPRSQRRPRMTFTIRDDNSFSVQFSTTANRSLGEAMKVYCKRSGRAFETVRFILAGSEVRVNPRSTPQTLGMEDGDEIRAYQESVGGFTTHNA
ncbi:hypothetical protein ACHAQH_003196 [Verticillium albo-atrum]